MMNSQTSTWTSTFDDVEVTVKHRIKNSKFIVTQVDESTDIVYFSVLLFIARYLKGNEVEKNIFLCVRAH